MLPYIAFIAAVASTTWAYLHGSTLGTILGGIAIGMAIASIVEQEL